jgi:hypothetical protein
MRNAKAGAAIAVQSFGDFQICTLIYMFSPPMAAFKGLENLAPYIKGSGPLLDTDISACVVDPSLFPLRGVIPRFP